jgi:hypothetical protein
LCRKVQVGATAESATDLNEAPKAGADREEGAQAGATRGNGHDTLVLAIDL